VRNPSVLMNQRLVALFVIGCLLFSYPLLALFNHQGEIFGIPVLFAYLFIGWAAFIVLLYCIVRKAG
jgi:hypothetical protein